MKHVIKFELPKMNLFKKKTDEAVEEGIELDLKERKINISGTGVIIGTAVVGFGLGYYVGKQRGSKGDGTVFIIK